MTYVEDLENRVHLLEETIEKLELQVEFGVFNIASVKGVETKLESLLKNKTLFLKNNKDNSKEFNAGKREAYNEIYDFIRQMKENYKPEKKKK